MTLQKRRAIEAATAAAEAALEARHPASARPDWFAASVIRDSFISADGNVVVSYSAERKVPLESNLAWEDSPRGPRLIRTDEVTGQRSVVITRDTGEFLQLFAVVFDVSTGRLEITVDTDLETVNADDIEQPGLTRDAIRPG